MSSTFRGEGGTTVGQRGSGGGRTASGAAGAAGEVLGAEDHPDGLVIADEAGQVVVFNSVAARITGAGPDDVLGKHITEALPLLDMAGRHWWECTDPYGGLPTRTRQPECSLLLPDGREVLVSARYVRSGPRAPLHRLVVTLRGAEARARSERQQADLVATVAHELRSPLTSVKGFTATLLNRWERFSDEQKRLMLETVNADADRVTRLITELLDISRIDSGRVEVRRQVVDVPGTVERQVAALVAAGEPPERFVVDIPDPAGGGWPEMWVDPDKLEQIMANLLENALRHGDGIVTVAARPVGAAEPADPSGPGPAGTGSGSDPGVVISVSDEGPGIPEELVGRVFTRFWRANRRGGTGLGLYIVKGLVEAHGGSIQVGRAAGGGAEFRLVLPAGAPDFAT